eukprot:546247_1
MLGRIKWNCLMGSKSMQRNMMSQALIDKYIQSHIYISEQDKQQYAKNGYFIVRHALSKEQLEIWRDRMDTAVDARGDDHIFPVKGQTDTVNTEFEYYKNVFIQRLNLWQNDIAACELLGAAGQTIGRIASELEGIDTIRLHHDQALYKEGFSNPTSFHCDVPFWTFSSLKAVTAWIALDDVTQMNGCMYMLQCSHTVMQNKKDPFKVVDIGKNMNEFFDSVKNNYPEFRSDEYKCIPMEMKAGDISFHNGLTVHAAGCNFTNKRRRAMTYAMFDHGATFNGQKNILTDEQFNNLTVGQVLDDCDLNPVLYSTVGMTNPNNEHFV